MTITIALAGKGGVGKTTVAAMVIKYLAQKKTGSILAIDADPSSNLNMVLGLELDWTVGDIREDMLQQVKGSLAAGGAAMGVMPGGQSKRDYLDYQIRTSVSEGTQYDLIAMGRGEGAGCYCAVNHNLREVIDTISKNYAYLVVDNEAGMEHLSRRTTRDVQHLLIVSDPSHRGLVAAGRVAQMSKELDINIENAYLIVNRMIGEIKDPIASIIKDIGVPLLGVIPADETISAYDLNGLPLIDMDVESPTFIEVSRMMEEIL
ncbi:AAA family ATPase [Chloroflexota bacterium]